MFPADGRIAALLEQFAARVRRRIDAGRLGRYGIEAADVEQEVHLRLWRALQRDPVAHLPAAYINRVVVTVIVDALRRAKARPEESLEDFDAEAENFPHGALGPEGLASHCQSLDNLAHCVASLSPRRRKPVQLYLQGYSLQEVADALGLTLDSARGLVQRGLGDIRQRFTARLRSHCDDAPRMRMVRAGNEAAESRTPKSFDGAVRECET